MFNISHILCSTSKYVGNIVDAMSVISHFSPQKTQYKQFCGESGRRNAFTKLLFSHKKRSTSYYVGKLAGAMPVQGHYFPTKQAVLFIMWGNQQVPKHFLGLLL